MGERTVRNPPPHLHSVGWEGSGYQHRISATVHTMYRCEYCSQGVFRSELPGTLLPLVTLCGGKEGVVSITNL